MTIVSRCMIRSCIYNVDYSCTLEEIVISRIGDCLRWEDIKWTNQGRDTDSLGKEDSELVPDDNSNQ